MIHQHVNRLRHHRNILYGYVFMIFVILVVVFLALTAQVSRLSADLAATQKALAKIIEQKDKEYLNLFNEQDNVNNLRFSNLSKLIVQQQKTQSSFANDISILKSSQGDFSGIITTAVKSVVAVGTDYSTGTGFVVHPHGLIITNYHVVSAASTIAVMTSIGEVYPATLVGKDSLHDLALLSVKGINFEALPFADSRNVQVGQKVAAIGNPLGLSFSASVGVVSGLHREGPSGFREYLQTDVSLNPGNSGGPLLDQSGRVIGIANFKLGESEGLGFALESNILRDVINILANQTIIQTYGT